MRHPVTPTWSVELPDDGVGEINDDGDLVVESSGRTIYAAPWLSPGTTPADVYAQIRAQPRPPVVEEHLGEEDGGTIWWAGLFPP